MKDRLFAAYTAFFVYFLWNKTVLYSVWLVALLMLSVAIVRVAPPL